MNTQVKTVEEYLQTFSEDVQNHLIQVRETILKAAPEAKESISYGMPAYKLHGKPLVYFGGHKNHIGFYATPAGHEAFAKELSIYTQGKGSVQFPFSESMPLALIQKMVEYKVQQMNSLAKK